MDADAAHDPKNITASVAVIGGGPAGLMAADILSAAGLSVTVYERMPTVGRKFLMAGRGGLNLTHAEDLDKFLSRYGASGAWLRPAIEAFPPTALRAFAEGLGQKTFVGSSGRVFPIALKASPLLRAWLARLSAQGVQFALRRQWIGWDSAGRLVFRGSDGESEIAAPDATVLALGGASWPRLGADGGWVEVLQRRGVEIVPLRAANCGFTVAWSEPFRQRFAGAPLKNVALSFAGLRVRGEAVVTGYGMEGGAVYALSAPLRDAIAAGGPAVATMDLRPDVPEAAIAARLAKRHTGESLANALRKAAGLGPLAVNLLRESARTSLPREPDRLAALIKSVPLVFDAPQGLDRAISTAGGIAAAEFDGKFMLRDAPGTLVAGEMLDWEAPTGGYLLQACFSTGAAAARGVLAWLTETGRMPRHERMPADSFLH